MTTYRLVLFFHVLMVVVTFGVAGVLHTAMIQMRSAARTLGVRTAVTTIAKLEPVFPLSALLLFLAGAYLVHASWQWSDGWIITSIVGLVIMEAVGGVVLKKEVHHLVTTLGDTPDGSPVTPEMRSATLSRAAWTGSHFNSAVALGIVFLMTVKPSGVNSVIAIVVFAAAGVASAVPFTRPVVAQPSPRPAEP